MTITFQLPTEWLSASDAQGFVDFRLMQKGFKVFMVFPVEDIRFLLIFPHGASAGVCTWRNLDYNEMSLLRTFGEL